MKPWADSTKRAGAAVFVAVCVLASSLPTALAASASGSAGPAPATATLVNGIEWRDEQRLTNSLEDDFAPQVTLDANAVGHILWRKHAATGEAFFAQYVNTFDGTTVGPYYISNRTTRGTSGEVMVGRSAGFDSNGDIHIAYDDGLRNIKYQKVGPDGTTILNEKQVGPQDNMVSHLPSLVVGIDDTVHIAHLEDRFQPTDVAYDKLTNDGGDIWIDRVVSSDMGGLSQTMPNIVADFYNGDILFVMGTDQGTYLGRFNKYGVKDMPSVRLRNATDYLVADVGATPNGTMHVVWQEAGSLLYSAVNQTGVLIRDTVVLVDSGNVTGTPRVGATSNNGVYVVWEERVSGASQVFLGQIAASGALDPATRHQLSSSSVGAHSPSISVGPDDEPFVVWVDTRHGNGELYFRFGGPGDCELATEPISLGSFFYHPNETRVTTMTVRNSGYIVEDFVLNLSYIAPPGWQITLDRTLFPAMRRGDGAEVNLSVYVPPDAREGDNASISVVLSTASGSCMDVINFPAFVRVTRELRLSGEVQKVGRPGDTISFGLFIANRGDVREDDIQLLHIVGVGDNWPVTLSKTSVSLDPGEATNFTVYITVPPDAPGGAPGLIQVVAYSSFDPTVRAGIQLRVEVPLEFGLQAWAEPEIQEVAPGATAVFRIQVNATGNLVGSAKVAVQVPGGPTGFTGWQKTIDRNVVYLASGQSEVISLQVYVPPWSPAGIRVDLAVRLENLTHGAVAIVNTTTIVANVCRVELGGGALQRFLPGESHTTEVLLLNNGNVEVTGGLRARAPPGWAVTTSLDGATGDSLIIPRGGGATAFLGVDAPDGAFAGDYAIDLVFEGQECGNQTLALEAIVESAGGAVLSVDVTTLRAAPGERVTFTFDVASTRNAPMEIQLAFDYLHSTLLDFEPVWAVPAAGSDEPTYLAGGRLPLSAFERAQVTLTLTVPLDIALHEVDLIVQANVPAFHAQFFPLRLQVAWPDLSLSSVEWPAAPYVVGQSVTFRALVENVGHLASGSGYVSLMVDGAPLTQLPLPSLEAGSSFEAVFNWTAVAGEHTMKFRLVVVRPPPDLNVDNDAREVSISVWTANTPPPLDSGAQSALTALVLFAAAAGIVLLALRRTQRRTVTPPPPRSDK